MLPSFAVAFRVRVVRAFVREVDTLARLAFYGTGADAAPSDEAAAAEEASDHPA